MARKRLSPVPTPVRQAPGVPEATATATPEVMPALQTRAPIAAVSGNAAAEAALAEVTREMAEARAQGRFVEVLPLDAVEVDHFVRDRLAPSGTPVDEDMVALCESIRARGQQMPIEVVDIGQGRYGLISGWRRLRALRFLHDETGEFGTILAVLRAPADAADAYVAMVEENELRVGLSYFERARIVLKAVEQGVYPDSRAALRGLFSTASRAKRSKIGAFIPIVSKLGDALTFPAALPERLGLALAKRMDVDPGFAAHAFARLHEAQPASPREEHKLLTETLSATNEGEGPGDARHPERTETAFEGLSMRMLAKSGEVVLKGAGVTPEFQRALAAWLGERA